MMRILFFADFREQLDTRQLELELDESCTVSTLIARLIRQGGENWRRVLESDNLVIAVNQTICDAGKNLVDGDEIAFYPPVTGG